MVGKYIGLSDSYLSVIKALMHAAIACCRRLCLDWVAATDLEDATRDENPSLYASSWETVKRAEGILVPGGFGERGVQGKILATKFARENNIPFLGVCLGMQIAVIEFARTVLKLENANSTEFDADTPYPCVVFMPEVSKTHMGGTMRLGARRTYFTTVNCLTAKLYTLEGYCDNNGCFVEERHRHRYEVNPDMVNELEAVGLKFVGKDESGCRMEIVEIPELSYFVGVQFHPEFKSRPGRPTPVFLGLILAASGLLTSYLEGDRRSVLSGLFSSRTSCSEE